MIYTYPLKLNFKLLALAPRLRVIDATGSEIFYIEQKLFALKEAVKVFNNETEKRLLFTIKADRILDFGARYYFHTPEGKLIGSIQKEGVQSLFQASFTIFDANEQQLYKITQSNPWIAFLDSLINSIPFAEFVTGFILNPIYVVKGSDAQQSLARMKKQPSLFESQFAITLTQTDIKADHELILLLSFLMIVQLERNRG